MPSTGTNRIGASLKALALTWLIAGVVFCILVRGPGTLIAWVIWGTGVFLVGWLVIALPLIAIGDYAMRLPGWALAFAGGCAGALLMMVPDLLVRSLQPNNNWTAFSFRDLAWPSVAFPVGFLAVALYRTFLFGSFTRRRPIQAE